MGSESSHIKLREVDQQLQMRLQEQNIPGLASRVLACRGISEPQTFFGNSSTKLPGVNGGSAAVAATRLAEAVVRQKRICFVSDFDADGVCAAAIISAFMRQLEAKHCIRFCKRGDVRGLGPEMVRKINEDCASVIVTADNGISSIAAAQEAKRHGIELVITDHHTPGDELPEATAIANPMLPDSGLPCTNICGAMVVLLVLREAAKIINARLKIPNLLDLAAVATIADMMPMSEPFNRQVVAAGISLIRSGHCQVGIKAIIGESRCPNLTTRDISFRVAPVINAAGRLGKAERSYCCLAADNFSNACEIAQELEGYNRERRLLTRKITEEATSQISTDTPFNFAYSPDWPDGMLGLVASKLVSITGRPSVVVGKAGKTIRGSMRSADNISVRAILSTINERSPELLGDFGGHAGAAGFALLGNIEKLKKEFASEFALLLREPPVAETVYADAEPDFDELCDGSIEYLSALPWGRKFPEPVFLGSFRLEQISGAASGNGYNHRLMLGNQKVVAWHSREIGNPGAKLRLLYRTSASKYKGSPPLLFVNSVHNACG